MVNVARNLLEVVGAPDQVPQGLFQAIQQFSAEGWELMATLPTKEGVVGYFKRQKRDVVDPVPA